jgi:outer membrane protein TolC
MMTFFKLIPYALSFSTLLAGFPLFALEPVMGDSLEEYLTRALNVHPGVEAAEKRYQAATQRAPQVAALPNPMLQVTHFVESVQTRTGPQENILMLNQQFPWFGTLDHKEKAAAAEAEALWYDVQKQQLNLIRDLSEAFYDYVYTREALERTTQHLRYLGEWEPVVETRVKTGGNLNELLRLKVEIGKLNDSLQSLRQNRIRQSARLAEMLAFQTEDPLPWPETDTPDPVEIPTGKELDKWLEKQNPDLLKLKSRIRRAEALQEVAKLQSYPDLVVGATYIQVGDPVTSTTPTDGGEDAWGVTAAVSVPLQFGRNKAAREEAASAVEEATNLYDQKRNALRADVQAAMASLADAERRINLYGEELLPLANQAVKNTRTAYEGSQASLLELIDSERSQLDLQLLYERAVRDAAQQSITLKTLLNLPPVTYETEK